MCHHSTSNSSHFFQNFNSLLCLSTLDSFYVKPQTSYQWHIKCDLIFMRLRINGIKSQKLTCSDAQLVKLSCREPSQVRKQMPS